MLQRGAQCEAQPQPPRQQHSDTHTPRAKHQHLPAVTCKEHPVFHKTSK